MGAPSRLDDCELAIRFFISNTGGGCEIAIEFYTRYRRNTMTASETSKATVQHPQPHLFTITVNGSPVSVAGPKTTGRQIKQAAIDGGVPIQLDFILSEELPNRKTRL